MEWNGVVGMARTQGFDEACREVIEPEHDARALPDEPGRDDVAQDELRVHSHAPEGRVAKPRRLGPPAALQRARECVLQRERARDTDAAQQQPPTNLYGQGSELAQHDLPRVQHEREPVRRNRPVQEPPEERGKQVGAAQALHVAYQVPYLGVGAPVGGAREAKLDQTIDR
jgi:hypothetical protein